MSSIDVRSADIVLVHDGSERGAVGAPARDLSGNDIGRLVYRRSLAEVFDVVGRPIDPADPDKGVIVRPDPRQPDSKVAAEVIDELIASGRYARAGKPKAAGRPETTPPAPETAEAAEKPEN